MVDVVEIFEPELPRWLAVASRLRPQGGVDDQVDWKRQAEDLGWFVATVDGQDAGAGIAIVGWHSPPGVGRGNAFVLPEFRGRGVGTAVFGTLARWVAERGCIELDSTVREDDPDALAWAERRGFREIGRNSTMVLHLGGVDPPAVEPPDGIEVVSWADRPELAEGLYAVYVEADPDIPGESEAVIPPLEEWLSRDMQGASDNPRAVFVALAGDEVVGYAKLSLSSAEPDVAYHDLTGVKRAWRGRGIAGALKRAQIAWAKQQGYERLETMNEERNEPIRRLNARHGYRLEPGEITVRGALSGPD